MIPVKNIMAEYLLMSNPNFELFSEQALEKNTLQQQKHLYKTPVFIVTFERKNEPAWDKGS
ncbi:hypothetical protein BSK49_00080 [Paenibacillus odorifer]|uniref:hypothetical protein n=1 Tax=Paenibacillus odorifer TaxID=189426 RepID=UPI00096EF3B6|nr:hypothetical protein [Paenibacillus odorifer]OMD92828.1 hypothetical protein BSK49_00080 [Paenibacillus odorifer]